MRILKEYEEAEAHLVKFQFNDETEREKFIDVSQSHDTITALRSLERQDIARQVILNTITMALVSDCAHHIYESLKCFEKRKFIPAFNLLRKPLIDNLLYISWMVADEDDFYSAYTSGSPEKLTQKIIGNRRANIIHSAIEKTDLGDLITANEIVTTIYNSKNTNGLYGLFQHAVHLVTVDRIEIKTSPENFNFIFKSPNDNDLYETLYTQLPTLLLYLTQIIAKLFDRISPMDTGSQKAFSFRTINGYRLIKSKKNALTLAKILDKNLSQKFHYHSCKTPFSVSPHNAARLLLTDTYRCGKCKRVHPFPFSWIL
ncbi:hypothetical protein [Chromobacterium haemolyticum]|uniref:hypothetical protein n=1 Tax=Chromobacterium haemolyticum TaxID=394935 RepID=UPI001374D6B0|nr:hypothetical protein [Chromobacterium haemolyticum]